MALIHIETKVTTPTLAAEKFDPANNVVRYSRATYTPTAENGNNNGFAAAAAMVAEQVDRLAGQK